MNREVQSYKLLLLWYLYSYCYNNNYNIGNDVIFVLDTRLHEHTFKLGKRGGGEVEFKTLYLATTLFDCWTLILYIGGTI